MDAWLGESARDLPPERLLRRFEAGLAALWQRTETTLGQITLTAIADRVLYVAAEKFPLLSALKVEPSRGFECGALGERLAFLKEGELLEGMRFVLVEFLTVLGNLTAEILTPELHAELSRVGFGQARPEATSEGATGATTSATTSATPAAASETTTGAAASAATHDEDQTP